MTKPYNCNVWGWRLGVALVAAVFSSTAADWPQLQHNAARQGRTHDTVKPPYRARWIWFGPDFVLRNKDSRPGGPDWRHDLRSEEGKDYPMPKSVPFSFAGSMQPVVFAGAVYVADVQGQVYALDENNGTTRWVAPNPGGTFWPGGVGEEAVAFPSLLGYVTAYDRANGKQLWQYDTGRTLSSSPALLDGVLYVGSQSGKVIALQLASGAKVWESDDLGGPIQGGLCVANGRVYVGVDNLDAVALEAKTGRLLARRRLSGQSFRFVWPVAVRDRVVFTSVPVICPGSEYVNDPILAGTPDKSVGWVANAQSGYADLPTENRAVTDWIARGRGKAWETCFSLRADSLDKDYIVATGATEGCGASPDPPAIDWADRPIVWWATAFPTLTKHGTFGSSYSMDLSTFDLTDGRRVPIENRGPDGRPRLSGQTTETDNLYGMTIGGDMLFLRQNFRGTWCINLKTSAGAFISQSYRHQDGGNWLAAVNYANGSSAERWPADTVRTPSTPPGGFGRVGPSIANGRIFFTEEFAVTCVETAD